MLRKVRFMEQGSAVEQLVTTEECKRSHRIQWSLLSVILTLMGIFVVVTGWSLTTSLDINSRATYLETRIATHQAQQDEVVKHILLRLDEIRADVKELRK